MARRRVSIDEAKTLFDRWRGERTHSARHTPDELRDLALALCEEHGEKPVRKELKLSSSTLWQWRLDKTKAYEEMLDGGEIERKKSEKSVNVPEVKAADFIEVALLPAPKSDSDVSFKIEWQRQDGATMAISGLAMAEVGELMAQFLGGVRQ